MDAIFVMKIYCVPPDINQNTPEVINKLLDELEQIIKYHAKGAFAEMAAKLWPYEVSIDDIPVGISLVADVSDYHLGDMIWAEGEFCGDSVVRSISWSALNGLAAEIALRINNDLIREAINNPHRLTGNNSFVPCTHISVRIGCENGPVTATQHSKC